MIPIKKHQPPHEFKNAIKNNPLLTYKDFSEEREYSEAFTALRKNLLKEQGYICCYCQSQIDLANVNGLSLMRVEHFIPKGGTEKDESLQLEYSNLLASCMGNVKLENDDASIHCCDHTKSQRRLQVIPNPSKVLQPNFDAYIKYAVMEREERVMVKASYKDETLDADINIKLNLNNQQLTTHRFSVWSAIKRKVIDLKSGKFKLDVAKELLEEYKYENKNLHNAKLRPFCGFIVYWLTKKIKENSLE
ncbi:TIGR02646 family protein [Sphingobacteriales bacterium UPWRP_1]|nr:TIGR02646 family protein [Sphingobacteriales bacterium TSM_CSM]PSJ77802.1 TIGR02646 family protein [Sphingobacteriales bacterium UPWRP_1]